MKSNKKPSVTRRNPVARHAARFQKARVFRDRSKYCRKLKHRKGSVGESLPVVTAVSDSPMISLSVLVPAFHL